MARTCKRWTASADSLLIELKAMRVPAPVIAKRLGRTVPAVNTRYSNLKLDGAVSTEVAEKKATVAKSADTEFLVTRLIRALDSNTAAMNRLADEAETRPMIKSNGHDRGMLARLFA